MLSAFPIFDDWTAQLTDFIFANFVPSSARGGGDLPGAVFASRRAS